MVDKPKTANPWAWAAKEMIAAARECFKHDSKSRVTKIAIDLAFQAVDNMIAVMPQERSVRR